LVDLRDKFYAHIDRQDQNFVDKISLTYNEIEFLLKILHDFIYEIKHKVFNTHVEFTDDIFVDLTSVLRITEDYNRKHHEEIIKEFNEETKRLKSK